MIDPRIHDRALLHKQVPTGQMRRDHLEQPLRQPVLLQSVPEGQDRRLVRDRTEQRQPRELLPRHDLVLTPLA
jgi:hypothetical protein